MNAKNLKRFVIALAVLSASSSFALGGLSRACNFRDIPPQLQSPALVLFAYLDMPQKYLDLPSRSEDEKKQHWILESITTDYGSLRYYLFVENEVYRLKGSQTNAEFFRVTGYRSPWAAQSLDPRIFPDSRLSVFNFNRGTLFSARAGHKDIVQFYSKTLSWREVDWFRVVGKHYYFDPVSKSQGYIGKSDATDCALSQWGFETR